MGDGKPLYTIEDMYEMAVKVGANSFIATSAKNGYGLIEDPEETDNFCGNADSITEQGDQWVKAKILEFAQASGSSEEIPVLKTRVAAAAVAPAAPAPVEPVKQAEKKEQKKKDESCCTLL